MILAANGLWPCMVQLTTVLAPCGTSLNSTWLSASMGLCICRRIFTRVEGWVSVMLTRPEPTSALPSKSTAAPGPLAGPEYVVFMLASRMK